MAKHRLQKVLSEAGICSRRQAEKLLLEHRITVNGTKASVGEKADPTIDQVKLDGVQIPLRPSPKVILLNKPKNIICTCKDKEGRKTVLELLPRNLRRGLYPVGRLDYESRGALLITNQGELTMRLTHPRFLHPKIYNVWVKGLPSKDTINNWREGVNLDGKLTLKTHVHKLKQEKDKTLLQVVLREGRNRQIRRTAALLGHKVIDLQRISIDGISIEGLEEGQWKEINEKDWKSLLIKNTQ